MATTTNRISNKHHFALNVIAETFDPILELKNNLIAEILFEQALLDY